jgi:hypothetical protein
MIRMVCSDVLLTLSLLHRSYYRNLFVPLFELAIDWQPLRKPEKSSTAPPARVQRGGTTFILRQPT